MSYRKVNWSQDAALIIAALTKLNYSHHRYSFIYKANLNKAVCYVHNAVCGGNAYIVNESILLLVSDIIPWCSDDNILQEELVLSLVPDVYVLTAITALEAIAKERGSDHIILSDSSIELRLSKAYTRRGYTKITNQFYKEA